MERYRVKYPRTKHLPWSESWSSDDLKSDQGDHLYPSGTQVVVTEKLDGENTTLYRDGLHARSIDSRHHPSRTWVKSLQGRIGHLIPPRFRICGENMYARHSIPYDQLLSYFYVFSVWEEDRCLSWDDTTEWAALLGLHCVPTLYQGAWNPEVIRELSQSLDLSKQEGYVVRPLQAFQFSEFSHSVYKWVRKNHVQTDQHWMRSKIVPNRLVNDCEED